MRISEGTKISELIRLNPNAIEVIASINSHFEKLRNPILRKILASRVTIKDASKIGGCSIDLFFEKLATIGFERVDRESDSSVVDVPSVFIIPPGAKVVTLDVRPDIDSGSDPFQKILSVLSGLEVGNYLELINSFEPAPLISVLRKKNYPCTVQSREGLIYTYISKQIDSKPLHSNSNCNKDEFDKKLALFDANVKVLDVRELEMPGPMVAILQELDQLPDDFALHVYHRRIPQFLLAELKLRAINILINEIGEGNVELLIYK